MGVVNKITMFNANRGRQFRHSREKKAKHALSNCVNERVTGRRPLRSRRVNDGDMTATTAKS